MAKYELNYEAIDAEEKQKTDTAEDFLDWVETIIYSFFAVILIFTFLMRIAVVSGESMVPTLQDRDRLIVSYIGYEPKQGDIVIVDCENPALDKILVKRVIATAGQTVDIDFEKGEVKVDNKVLDEPYINDLTMLDEHGHEYPTTVPDGCIFVMGDNRMNSTDSRSGLVGFVPEEDVLGHVVLRIFPFSSFGSLVDSDKGPAEKPAEK